MSIAAVLRELMNAGLQGEALISAVARVEAAQKVEKGAARAARNRRYYEKNKTIKTSEASCASETSDNQGPSAPLVPPLPPAPPSPPYNPPTTQVSDPNGSAAVAATEPMDPRMELFGRGKSEVRRLTGRSAEQCGSLIGKWLKLANDSAVIVLAAIDEAGPQELANPVPWIGQRIKLEMSDEHGPANPVGRQAASGGYRQSSFDDKVAGVVSALDRFRQRSGQQQGHYRPDDAAARPQGRDAPSIVDADWAPARSYR